MKKLNGRSLQDMAVLYVKTINSAPNGWGQYCHPEFGQSHNIMIEMSKVWGVKETNNAIKKAMEI